jgi:hypothetical protein
MKSEEIAVLRILYKHKGLLKLSKLIDGFPDESRSRVIEAVTSLQLQSFLSITDCSSVLHISMNRQARRAVLELLEGDTARTSSATRVLKNHIHLNHRFQLKHPSTDFDTSYKSDLKALNVKNLWSRSPQRALKLSTVLVCSFVILGTFAILNSQSTTTSSTYGGYGDKASEFMFASSLSPETEMQEGKTIPVEHIYDSQHNWAYSDEPVVYEGVFTKLESQLTSYDDPPLYYHYIISEKKDLLLLEQIRPGSGIGDSNSSLSIISDKHGKEISTT